MLRRFFVRSCFMVPILLCLAGWGWSVNHYAVYYYHRPPTTYWLGTSWGIVFVETSSDPNSSSRAGWRYGSIDAHWLPPNQPNILRSLGFAYRWDSQWFAVYVPYWFIILLFSLLLFLVWRWTRAKGQGRGFEVILKDSAGSKPLSH